MDKTEVIKLMAHLVITIFLIACYVGLYIFKGVSDPVLQTAIGATIGYWFSVMNSSGKTKQPPTDGGSL